MAPRPQKRDTKAQIRAAQREWLARVIEATGNSLSRIAQDAGASDTTLTRFFNDPRYQGTLHPATVQAISISAGVPGPGVANVHQLQREEARLLQEGEIDAAMQAAIAGLVAARPRAQPWLMRSSLLTLAGIRPGDIMIIDAGEYPKDGDIVCAKIDNGAGALTVFRLLQTPNLVAASFDPAAVRPELVDNVRVRIAGVMTDLIRRRI